MALTPIKVVKRGTSGGAGIGSIIGGALGAVVGTIAGGNTAAGWGVGSAAGGAVGGAVAPGKGPSEGHQIQQSAVERRLASQTPQIPESKVLEESLVALKDTNHDIVQAYGDPLLKAYEMSLAKRRGGMT